MGAKALRIEPISSKDARRIIQSLHYSGKYVNNSQVHFGVFLHGRCGGAVQFGPSMYRRKLMHLVKDTAWNGFLELNRMALADWLPRNSESRALTICLKLLRRQYPFIEWIITFADGTQCGDGTIYRAAGFVLTAITKNRDIYQSPSGEAFSKNTLTKAQYLHRTHGSASMKPYKARGWKLLPGFQMQYIAFLNKAAQARLTVPILPYAEIARRGATMYKGQRPASIDSDAAVLQTAEGGASPTAGLSVDVN